MSNKKNTFGTLLLSILGGFIGVIIFLNVFDTKSNIVQSVTANKIKQIKPGTSLNELIVILGRPFRIEESGGSHNIGCNSPIPSFEIEVNNSTNIQNQIETIFKRVDTCCSSALEHMKYKTVTLTYTKSKKINLWCYPMLWVHMDKNLKVIGVYAKSYDWLDDIGIYNYSCSYNENLLKFDYDKTEKFIQEEIFNGYFK